MAWRDTPTPPPLYSFLRLLKCVPLICCTIEMSPNTLFRKPSETNWVLKCKSLLCKANLPNPPHHMHAWMCACVISKTTKMRNGSVSLCALWISHTRTVSRLIIGFSVSAEDIAGKQKCALQLYGANEDLALLSNKWCSSFLSLARLSHKHTALSSSLTPFISCTAYLSLHYQYSCLYLCLSAHICYILFRFNPIKQLCLGGNLNLHLSLMAWINLITLKWIFALITMLILLNVLLWVL